MDKIRTNNGFHVNVETMKDDVSIETLYDNTDPLQASAEDFDYNMDMKVKQVTAQEIEDPGSNLSFSECSNKNLCKSPEPSTSNFNDKNYDYSTVNMLYFESILQTCINRKEYLCCHCNKSSDWDGIIIEHKIKQTGNNPYQWQCNYCFKRFAGQNKIDMGKHLRNHIQDKPFKCIQCCRDLAQITRLVQRQIRTQKNNLLKNINTCPEETNINATSVVRFYRSLHRKRTLPEEKPYKCSLSTEKFKMKNSLVEHQNIHTKVKLHTCSQCNMTFSRKGQPTNHQETHTRNQPYQCSQCEKKINEKSFKNPFVNTHSGDTIPM
ncbi:unnamed protein product [Meganyctiphanes norvegica]|uniref:C2H2-type domain-containing protein n=1 Tax=Meganyctiphanes norvegica TaxID=48144 RepID=A0AAV2RSH2_MEGNR